MEQQFIVAEMVQSNQSDNQVWFVHVTGSDSPEHQGYCKSAIKAMRFAFVLKQRAQCRIADESLQQLMLIHSLTKAAAVEGAETEPAEGVPAGSADEDSTPKQRKTKRTKKEKAAA